MSRYSPQVLPQATPGLADSLVQGVNSYLQTRQRRKQEQYDQNAEQRATNVDSRATAELGIREDQNARQQQEADEAEQTRPLDVGEKYSRGLDMGVHPLQQGEVMPQGGVAVPGQAGVYINPQETGAAVRQRQADALLDIRRGDQQVRREGIDAAGKRVDNIVGGRVKVAQIRASTAGAGGGPRGAGNNSTLNAALRDAGSQLRQAQRTRAQMYHQIQINGGDPTPDEMDQMRQINEEVKGYESQRQTLLHQGLPNMPVQPQQPEKPEGQQFFQQPFSTQFQSPSNTQSILAVPRGQAPAAPAPQAGPVRAAPPAPMPRVSPQATRLTAQQIEQMAQSALSRGKSPESVAQRKAELLRANGLR